MKDDTQTALEAMFKQHDERKQAAQKAIEEKKSEEDLFLDAFLQKRDEVIRPAMEEIGEFVKKKGYDYEIVTQEDTYDPRSYRGTQASIGIRFKKASDDAWGHYGSQAPNFIVICEKGAQRVRFHENTMMGRGGGHAGSAGEAKLDDLASDRIQKMLLKVMAEIFR